MKINHRIHKLTLAAVLIPALAVSAMLLSGGLSPAAAQGVALQGLGGERLSEADLSQGSTIVVVWASWSPRSRDIVGRVNSLVDKWGGKARVVTVNFQDERSNVERFLTGKGLNAPVFLDLEGTFSKKYAVATLPGLLIVKNGRVVFSGKLPDDPDRTIAERLN